MRKGVVLTWLVAVFMGIVALFWYHEWKYNLPTPVPEKFKAVNTGSVIDVTGKLQLTNNKPVFLHFFNPGCPCSRFNIPHFKSLVKEYGSQVNFAIVLMTDKKYTEKAIQDKFELNIPVLTDTSLAVFCGVYSTPQAVIINTDHTLHYRGNYNRSRYCTDKKTNYAQIALDALFDKSTAVAFDRFALKAYGCQLPKCTKK